MLLYALGIVLFFELRLCSAVIHPFFEFHGREKSLATFSRTVNTNGRAPMGLLGVHGAVFAGSVTVGGYRDFFLYRIMLIVLGVG